MGIFEFFNSDLDLVFGISAHGQLFYKAQGAEEVLIPTGDAFIDLIRDWNQHYAICFTIE